MAIETAFSSFPTLKTDRLILREIRAEDDQAFFQIFSDPSVMQYMDFLPHQSIDETRLSINRTLEQYRRKMSIKWVIIRQEDDTAMGSCDLFRIDKDHHHAEIGYKLHPSLWRQGIMRETATAILTYAFEQMELHRVEAETAPDNTASKKLLESLGFAYEGCLRQHTYIHSIYEDDFLFGLLRDEWEARAEEYP